MTTLAPSKFDPLFVRHVMEALPSVVTYSFPRELLSIIGESYKNGVDPVECAAMIFSDWYVLPMENDDGLQSA